MRIIHDPRKLSILLRAERARGRSIGFVPTMGALHEGHASLIRRARGDNDIVVASIFVNPLQFGPKEDFGKYPRPVRQDLAVARRAGVDYVFCPSAGPLLPLRGWVNNYAEHRGQGISAESRRSLPSC
jgi:pantoate--beta-alanine ligase